MADHSLWPLPDAFETVALVSEADTVRLANDLAVILKRGDTVCLSGDLGAGKSTFARALIRSFAGDPELEVPSPTFTLVQTYGFERFDLSHFDLYRLEEPEELEELALDDLLGAGAALIEWPEMAQELLPQSALWIQFTQPDADSEQREVRLWSAAPDWRERVAETLRIRSFLTSADRPDDVRQFLAGDASLRTFETVSGEGGPSVLMRWPFQGDALPEAIGTYMEKVHLARDCRAVLAIGSELRAHGFLAPEVFAADPQKGLVLSGFLGARTIVEGGRPVPERYRAAVELLADMHGQDWPQAVALADGTQYHVPAYSADALIAEASLFLDWYVPEKAGQEADPALRQKFETVWTAALDGISDAQVGWVLRDFHSPNLLWQEGAEGRKRIGLIDFQDTVLGPVAYDVASLLLDARTDIDPALEAELFETYVSARESRSSGFDRQRFETAYAVMGAQRITKILGIFVRLARRDGKPAYLSHLPRMLGYLERVLDRPGMSELKGWYEGIRP